MMDKMALTNNKILMLGLLLLFVTTILTFGVKITEASNGDRSYVFGKCVGACSQANCTNITEFEADQPVHMQYLMWSCLDECKYGCMWVAVDAFHRDGSQVPQFFGKWPFIRYAGVQEPASAIFSILNGLSHLTILVYRKHVPSTAPMYRVWHLMALIGSVTWLCATIFHTRDTPLTEKLDYFSAFGLVLFNLFTLVCRFVGSSRSVILSLFATCLLVFYAYHIHYLAFIHFDYGYNMLVNVAFGAINAVGWMVWCLYHRHSKPHWWKCATVMFGLNALLGLELGDFPPIMWSLDAHAIWHAGTVPLNLLWYSFIIDDTLQELKLSTTPDFKKML